MKTRMTKIAILLTIALATGAPAFADKPDAQGNSGAKKSSQENFDRPAAPDGGDDSKVYFNEYRRNQIRNYYSKAQRSGSCPPGLAKKNNGCQPPGQAKKWRKGRPLPRDVAVYDLPAALIDELGRTPEGEKIVQVDSDLLLISVATGMVIDAIDVYE
jgi:Ni/Co efflux regulator RcnB